MWTRQELHARIHSLERHRQRTAKALVRGGFGLDAVRR